MKQNFKFLLGLVMALSFTNLVAQPTVRIDATKTHQRITGFGGFVCSPQFAYNHMSDAEIKKVWGPESTIGCNIMRLYIPIGKNIWSQSLETAKKAKQMGLIVFASPWGQPAEWKTNNSSNANNNGTLGKLKRDNWADYAQYLEDYVKYMRDNGVELDAISIQNEPDEQATYAGCLWDPDEIAEFVKLYGPTISCKVMAPESVGASDRYVNALNKSDVLPGFAIYGGHQYGGIGTAYKNLIAKGKEIWMTEYLINWNQIENNTRNFDFSKDFFNFFRAINTCMLGDFNAWIHYAAKRYYAMMGDGERGAGSSGTITKRGYVMAHFAKYVTGMTRIDSNFGATSLEGSAYISETGDKVAVVIANATNEAVGMTMDIPFYTQEGTLYSTTRTSNMTATTLTPDGETCRPVVTVPAQSVSTVLFVKSRDRQPSDMKGSSTCFDRLDDMKTTKTTFGTTYQMSGKTKKLDHNNPLISSRTDASSGYVALDDCYSRLVIGVKKITSTMNYSSAKTTLTYVNAAGQVASHDYGDLNFDRHENFNLIFDISPTTLSDGCIGLISLTNNNWSSTLTLTLGDVTLDKGLGSSYAATLSGKFVEDDSYLQEYIADAACTSLDMTACSECPSQFPWLQGTNRVVWLPESSSAAGANLIHTDLCHQLELSSEGGTFRPARSFQAENISFTTTVNGCQLLMLPFNAVIPEGVKAYSISDDLKLEQISSIPAHTPVFIEAQGEIIFTGQGEVGYATSPLTATFRGTYTPTTLYTGKYVLAMQDGQWGLKRINTPTILNPFGVYATLTSQSTFIPIGQDVLGIMTIGTDKAPSTSIFDLTGRQMPAQPLKSGIYIRDGRKIVIK